MKKHTTLTSSDKTKSNSFIGVFLNDRVTELDYVYRGSSNVPETKFSEGFVARGSNPNLSNHIYNWPSDSAYVSSSLSLDAAAGFAVDKSRIGFVYEINPPSNGINVENHLYDDFLDGRVKNAHMEAFLSEREVSIPHQIKPSDIKGAWQVETFTDVSGTEGYKISSDFIPNPEYRPSTAVRFAQGAKALGHAVTAVGAGLDGYNLVQTYQGSRTSGSYHEFFKEATRIIASWTAAATMGAAPAQACMTIGAAVGPAGAVVGGLVCGAVGSFIGYTGASHMVNKALKNDGAFDPSKFQYKDENARVEAKWVNTSEKMNAIISAPASSGQPDIKIIKENTEFLKQMGVVNGANQLKLIDLSNETHHKLNAVLHEVKASQREIKSIYRENKKAQDAKDQEAKAKEEAINSYRGMEAGFNVIGQLGAITGNETLGKIGAVGAAGVSIAANAAMLTGAIPGVAFTGWGLMIPYAGIAMAGLAIITTLFGKKQKQDDSMMKALQALSDQIEAFRKEMEKHFEHLNKKMDAYHQDIVNKLTVLSNLLKTALNDSFDEINFKLDLIQEDLSRLGELLVKGLGAEYLKDFVTAISAIDQLTNAEGNRESKIEDNLITLRTWLTEVAIIKNTNGAWSLPNNLDNTNVFYPVNMRSHDKLLGNELSHRLGYLGKLSSLMLDTNFDGVDLENLPNIALFKKGVDAYAQGRMHIGSASSMQFDKNNVSINKIQANADNGLKFMEKINSQEKIILNYLTSLYNSHYQHLVLVMQQAATARLNTGTVSGFESPAQNPLNHVEIYWPANMIPSTAGYHPIEFTRLLHKLGEQSTRLHIPRLIKRGLLLGVGKMVATYTATDLSATRHYEDYGKWNGSHWKCSRGASIACQISYVLDSKEQVLYTISGSYGRAVHAQTGKIHHHGGGGHHTIGSQYDTDVARENSVPFQDFLLSIWPSVSLAAGFTDHTASPLTSELSQAIVAGIVTHSIATDPPISTAVRDEIIKEVLAHPAYLGDIRESLTLTKKMLKRFGSLMNTSVMEQINALWEEADFNAHATHFHSHGAVIAQLAQAINNIPDNVERATHPIIKQLEYCSALLEAVKQQETFTAHQNLAEIAEDLQVDEGIVIDNKRILCDFEKGTRLGVGSFGQVYKGTDAITRNNVAIKVFFTGASLQKDARGELDVTAKLSRESYPSPYLVQIMGVTRLPDHRMALVMEYVDNSTLWDHLHERQERLSWENAMSVSGQIIEGVSYLHDHGITHGDLKSANILLTSDFQVKICDYGLAKVATSNRTVDSTRPQSTHTHVGTQAYRAPELFKDKKARPNPQTDMYSLSVVIYEMITRLKPFHDTDGDDMTILPLLLAYMSGLSQDDPFEIPELAESEPQSRKDFQALYLLIFNECRNPNPLARPTAAALSQRLRVN